MGLFSKIFGGKTKTTYEHPQLGIFSLMYSKGGRNLWSSSGRDVTLTVRGSEHEPYEEHLEFLTKAENEIDNLHHAISKRFMVEFEEAELEVWFSDWTEKFKLAAIEVEDIIQSKLIWIVTFEELNEPYAHFNLHIEGQELKDFSIDT